MPEIACRSGFRSGHAWGYELLSEHYCNTVVLTLQSTSKIRLRRTLYSFNSYSRWFCCTVSGWTPWGHETYQQGYQYLETVPHRTFNTGKRNLGSRGQDGGIHICSALEINTIFSQALRCERCRMYKALSLLSVVERRTLVELLKSKRLIGFRKISRSDRYRK
jgi:hypothetical protein